MRNSLVALALIILKIIPLVLSLLTSLTNQAVVIAHFKSLFIEEAKWSAMSKISKQTIGQMDCVVFTHAVDGNSGFHIDGDGTCSVLDPAGQSHFVKCYDTPPVDIDVIEFHVPGERLQPGEHKRMFWKCAP